MYSYITFAAVIALTLGAAIHHPGHQAEHEHVVMHHAPGVVLEGVTASCTLAPSSPNELVRGLISLHQHHAGAPVFISGQVEGLTPGLHGFHLHRDGNTGDMCKAAGPHFNPTNATHGGPNHATRHAGDFGNIEADQTGKATFNFATYGVSLNFGQQETDIIGRAFVVHAKVDDLGRGNDAESLKTGNAGARVACCIITKQ